MAYKQNIVGVTVQPEEKEQLERMAELQGTKVSTLAKGYITKGLAADFALFETLNDFEAWAIREGFAKDADHAKKLVSLVRSNRHLIEGAVL